MTTTRPRFVVLILLISNLIGCATSSSSHTGDSSTGAVDATSQARIIERFYGDWKGVGQHVQPEGSGQRFTLETSIRPNLARRLVVIQTKRQPEDGGTPLTSRHEIRLEPKLGAFKVFEMTNVTANEKAVASTSLAITANEISWMEKSGIRRRTRYVRGDGDQLSLFVETASSEEDWQSIFKGKLNRVN